MYARLRPRDYCAGTRKKENDVCVCTYVLIRRIHKIKEKSGKRKNKKNLFVP